MEMAHTTKSLIKKNIFIVGEMVTDVLVQLEHLRFKFILKENNFRFLYSNIPLSQSNFASQNQDDVCLARDVLWKS